MSNTSRLTDLAEKKERQLIGIARRQLNVSDDAHRARVRRITQGRADSTLECDLNELRRIKAEYQALGWKPAPASAKDPKPATATVQRQAHPDPGAGHDWASTATLLPRIRQLLTVLGKGWGYAGGILRQQKGLPKGVSAPLELATAEELRGVIAALDRQRKREQAKLATPKADLDGATAWLDPAQGRQEGGSGGGGVDMEARGRDQG